MTHRDSFPRLSASTRVAWRCGTSEAACPVSKPWAVRKPQPTRLGETAVPVAQANRQRAESVRASESLDDVPHRPRLPSYPRIGPTDRLPDLYGSLSALLGISQMRLVYRCPTEPLGRPLGRVLLNESWVSARGADVGFSANPGRKSAHLGTSAFRHKRPLGYPSLRNSCLI